MTRVTGVRGLSQIYGQALDLFIDTGAFPAAHRATAYLDSPTVVVALDWLEQRATAEPDERPLPDRPLPQAVLSLIVGAQYSLRLGAAIDRPSVRTRFGEARELVIASLARQITDAGLAHVPRGQLRRDNREWLQTKTIGDDEVVAYLLSALTGNPIRPYEIEVSRDTRIEALKQLARDLGRADQFAITVAEAEEAARASQKESKFTLKRAALAAAGVAVVLAAPALVLVAAPAGLAGGAAIVAGLAALGPGGMLGGVGIVSVLAGAGGATAGSALMVGTAAQVEETVIFLQALARARHELRALDLTVGPSDYTEWFALIEMEDVAADELERLRQFSDSGAPGVREFEQKLKAVNRALEWLRAEGLAPGALPAGDDEAY